MRHEVPYLVHDIDPQVTVLDANVYMHPENQQTFCYNLHGIKQSPVAFLVGYKLVLPFRKWMSPGSDDFTVILCCNT